MNSPSSSNPPPSNTASNVTTPSTGVSSPSTTQNPAVSSPTNGTQTTTNPAISSPTIGTTGSTVTPSQAPSQAAPSGIAVTASSVSSPNSAPNVPTTTASSVTSPNASVSSPSVVSSVSSPNASSSASVVSSISSVTPPVSSIMPVGTTTVNPLGTYEPGTGRCQDVIRYNTLECDTTEDLNSESKRLKNNVANNSGDIAAQQTRLREIQLQLELRSRLGSDYAGDKTFQGITGGMYQHDIGDNPRGKLRFLENLLQSIERNEFTNEQLVSLGEFMREYRYGVDDTGRLYFYHVGLSEDYTSPNAAIGAPQETSQFELTGGYTIYYNTNPLIMNRIFGNNSPGTVFSFLAGALNGYYEYGGRNRIEKGLYTNKARGFSMLDFGKNLAQNSKKFGSKAKNRCDIGLSKPLTFDYFENAKPFSFNLMVATIRDFRDSMGILSGSFSLVVNSVNATFPKKPTSST